MPRRARVRRAAARNAAPAARPAAAATHKREGPGIAPGTSIVISTAFSEFFVLSLLTCSSGPSTAWSWCCSCRTSASPSRPRCPCCPAGSPTRRRPAPGPSVFQTVSNWPSARTSPMSTGLVRWWLGSILAMPPVRFGASMPIMASVTLFTSVVFAFSTAFTHIWKPITCASIGSLKVRFGFLV